MDYEQYCCNCITFNGSLWHNASHSMSATEKYYSQIEKEALTVTWTCDKFAFYIIGINVLIETDHKPLLSLLVTKNLRRLTS